MRITQYIKQGSALIVAMVVSAPVAADHDILIKAIPTVKTIAASLHSTLAVLIPRPITPADSGILFSMGRSDQADFTVTKSYAESGHSEVTGSNSKGDIGASIGYRKALSQRWSLDAQFERQRVRRSHSDSAMTTDTTAQTSEEISKIIAYWASVAGVYHAPITSKLSVHAGGGAFIWQRELKTNIGEVSASDKETGTNLMLQMGLGYRVIPRAKIEANVQRFFMPDKPVDRLSLGIVIQTD